ncbi:MAG: YvcK family protein [Anaerolineae bacterium]|nr:YvcK family protein [Anaerolineales bacterium]MCQ3971893.1 hypothetical protein [Anaerolineae bacterium]
MLASLKSTLRWLHPGLGLKRWLAPLLLGVVVLALGIALFLWDLYAASAYPPFLHLLLLQAWPRWLRAAFFSLIGLGLVAFSIYQLNKNFLSAFLPSNVTAAYVAEQVYSRQRQRQGPKVVAIGGGTGLSILLRGLKRHTDNIVAIVTVADDGGSSGKLRRELGVLPPGDFRNCIAALADDEALTTQLFQYRFRSGQGLEGHSFGNLFITAMAEVTGAFEKALYESGRVLNIRGTILPSTLENVTLMAEVNEGAQTRKVEGESAIPAAKLPIERVYLEPDAPRPFPPALQALLSADLIVAGPGSLYTSVIPNLLVGEIAAAIRASSAPKIYICNVATQPGETDGYSLEDHVQAIELHANAGFNLVLANNNLSHPIPASMSHLHAILPTPARDNRYTVIAADVVDEQYPWRHDPLKLAYELMSWYKKNK